MRSSKRLFVRTPLPARLAPVNLPASKNEIALRKSRPRDDLQRSRALAGTFGGQKKTRETRRAPETPSKLQFMCRGVSGMRISYAGFNLSDSLAVPIKRIRHVLPIVRRFFFFVSVVDTKGNKIESVVLAKILGYLPHLQ